MSCERCWDDAYLRSRSTPESQVEAYRYLLAVRDLDPAERRKCENYKRMTPDTKGDDDG